MSLQVAFIIVIVIWSTTPLAIVWSSEAFAPVMAVWLRMLIAVLIGGLLLRGRLPFHRQACHSYLAALPGIFGAMSLTYLAAPMVPSGLISVVWGTNPLIAGVMMSILPNHVRLNLFHWIACLLGLLGLTVVFYGAAASGPGEAVELASVEPVGLLLLLLAVSLQSGSAIWLQQVRAGLPPLTQTVGALLFAMPCFSALLWWTGDLHSFADLVDQLVTQLQPLSRGMLAVLYLAIMGSLVGFLCYFRLIASLPASTVALITLITPVIALALGSVFNGEALGTDILLGAAIILMALGLYRLGDYRQQRSLARWQTAT